MRALVTKAFLEVRAGFSPDRAVADPSLNDLFLLACKRLGLAIPDAEANMALLNLRKSGDLPELKSRRAPVRDQDEYAFASEIAVRFLERRDGISLDRIICDPRRAGEFDEIAARIAPGFTSFQYRWAGLALRKNSKLKPEIVARLLQTVEVRQFEMSRLHPDEVPTSQGVYLLFVQGSYLYAGETRNLHHRIKKHLDHSDNRGLARWLWEHEGDPIFLEYYVLPRETTTRARKAVELELIRSRKPLFNRAGIP